MQQPDRSRLAQREPGSIRHRCCELTRHQEWPGRRLLLIAPVVKGISDVFLAVTVALSERGCAMKNTTVSLVVGCGLLVCASIAGAQATQKSDQTPRFDETLVVTATPKAGITVKGEGSDYFLTFSGPVGVPGVTLAAGTYLFRFPAGAGTRVIQVLKADRSDTYAMFTTSPAHDDTRSIFSTARVVMWRERQAGAPPTIKEWYLPGQTTGYEFIYSKKPV
jgi:hypothetical protein